MNTIRRMSMVISFVLAHTLSADLRSFQANLTNNQDSFRR